MPTHQFACVAPLVVSVACLDEGFDMRAVQVRTHDAHALAIGPVQLSMNRIEFELLRRERAARRYNRRQMATVEIDPFDHPVVGRGATHDRPVDVPGLRVDGDPVWNSGAARDQHLDVGPVGGGADDAAAADIEEIEASGRRQLARAPRESLWRTLRAVAALQAEASIVSNHSSLVTNRESLIL